MGIAWEWTWEFPGERYPGVCQRVSHGHVVLLTGEAAIGNSRLVEVLKEQVSKAPHARWECRCSPYYQDSALYPLLDLFQGTLRLTRGALARKAGEG